MYVFRLWEYFKKIQRGKNSEFRFVLLRVISSLLVFIGRRLIQIRPFLFLSSPYTFFKKSLSCDAKAKEREKLSNLGLNLGQL